MVFSFAITQTIPKDLSHEQVWQGLQIKARNAVGFVPDIKQCVVLSENKPKNSFMRRANLEMQGAKIVMHEEVTEYAPAMVHFRTLENSTVVFNTISTDASTGDLTLTYTFHWDTGAPAESEEEQAIGSKIRGGLLEEGLTPSIERMRALVKEGTIMSTGRANVA